MQLNFSIAPPDPQATVEGSAPEAARARAVQRHVAETTGARLRPSSLGS